MDRERVTVSFGDGDEPWVISVGAGIVTFVIAGLLGRFVEGPDLAFELVAGVSAGFAVHHVLPRGTRWGRPDVTVADQLREVLDDALRLHGSSAVGTGSALRAGSLTAAQRDDLARVLDAEIANRRALSVVSDGGPDDETLRGLERLSRSVAAAGRGGADGALGVARA